MRKTCRATIVIPARVQSTRLSRKLLLDLAGESVLRRTVMKCSQVRDVRVVVLTEDVEIQEHLDDLSEICECYLTEHFNSGTERIVSWIDNISTGVVINVQGDEPLVESRDLDRMIDMIIENPSYVYTLDRPMKKSDYQDRSSVKMYKMPWHEVAFFTRSPIYYPIPEISKHIGIYGFSLSKLKEISELTAAKNSLEESLEQITWLENGMRIVSMRTHNEYISIDTIDNLNEAIKYVKGEA